MLLPVRLGSNQLKKSKSLCPSPLHPDTPPTMPGVLRPSISWTLGLLPMTWSQRRSTEPNPPKVKVEPPPLSPVLRASLPPLSPSARLVLAQAIAVLVPSSAPTTWMVTSCRLNIVMSGDRGTRPTLRMRLPSHVGRRQAIGRTMASHRRLTYIHPYFIPVHVSPYLFRGNIHSLLASKLVEM